MLSSQIPLSLYIHFPWCEKKCPYCDFNSHALLPESQLIERYVDCLLQDFSEDYVRYGFNRKLSSIFIGGGTPSLFTLEALERLLKGIANLSDWESSIEITIESNPSSSEYSKFEGFRSIGINRLSIGVQSFRSDYLEALGRVHSSKEAHKAIEYAIKVGFDNFNVDLMHSLPNQTVKTALSDLLILVDYKVPHISWYQLTIEPNTIFHKYPPTVPPELELQSIEMEGLNLLKEKNYQRYEVSGFMRQNAQSCRHNMNYWEYGDYIGIGAGACGKFTVPDLNQVLRTSKIKKPEGYMKSPNQGNLQEVQPKDRDAEFMMNALRLIQGVPLSFYSARTGNDLSFIESTLRTLRNDNLLKPYKDRLCLTSQGLTFLNNVVSSFI